MDDYFNTNFNTSPKYNDLKKFRTYSYYHVLMVTDTMDFVNEINSTSAGADTNLYMHTVNASGSTDPDKFLDLRYTTGKKNRYVIIANTATDGYLLFTSFHLHSLVTSGFLNKPEDVAKGGQMSDLLSLQIKEVFGARFIEYILAGCQILGIDSTAAIYVLKTIFVVRPL